MLAKSARRQIQNDARNVCTQSFIGVHKFVVLLASNVVVFVEFNQTTAIRDGRWKMAN